MSLKASEIRELSETELKEKYTSVKEELYQMNCKIKLGAVDRPSRIKELKRDIARICTILKEKENDSNKR